MNVRQCDLCGEVKSPGMKWWFLMEGNYEPSQFQHPKHWCDSCMKNALELLDQLRS